MKEIRVEFEPEIAAAAPALQVVRIAAEVVNGPTDPDLRRSHEELAARVAASYGLPDINHRPGIAATRAAYKALGKEPNRYRPAQEQLMRRIVNGKGLYFIDNLVDVCNYVSIASGYAVGAFDSEKIVGDVLRLGVGRAGEPYEGIGRGPINIEGMPVYRDAAGGVGSPTSDNERTKITSATRQLTVCVNIYGEEMPPAVVGELYADLLRRFCSATEISIDIFRPV